MTGHMQRLSKQWNQKSKNNMVHKTSFIYMPKVKIIRQFLIKMFYDLMDQNKFRDRRQISLLNVRRIQANYLTSISL